MSTPPSDRQRRLAEALRANLRRRKGQARAKTDAPDSKATLDQPFEGREEEAPTGR
ncbi:hypothetical protein M2336_000778 [Sphingobium sp. B1D7B]|uniref:hypothetical protein n=1 Tax=Sphingobium TaxID=165695 RepID=UPI0015EBAEF5|nr:MULTISPECIES: hypothetical protein [Sphingobium]MCW2363581.1 hypothetical protein [Sphingobium sp. B10D3B]MCW2392454.1 hypothetical protein [Sphingobium sp. B11D3A]MCW2403021.1 hypothetical protein [Sphingobium sp. B10D7B]MCW2404149.1 hypothetical protein [Sphingobium sp. B1D7B]MCW2409999.1 hypothetical protein [Sphingobium xanthum]